MPDKSTDEQVQDLKRLAKEARNSPFADRSFETALRYHALPLFDQLIRERDEYLGQTERLTNRGLDFCDEIDRLKADLSATQAALTRAREALGKADAQIHLLRLAVLAGDPIREIELRFKDIADTMRPVMNESDPLPPPVSSCEGMEKALGEIMRIGRKHAGFGNYAVTPEFLIAQDALSKYRERKA